MKEHKIELSAAIRRLAIVALAIWVNYSTAAYAQSPSSAVVFVLDRSGSMEANDPNNFSSVAANVALDYLELLDPGIQVGVIEFSDAATSLTNGGLQAANVARRALEASKLKPPGGGTSMMAAMRSAFSHLGSSNGAKRIVLLADGAPTDSFDEAEIVNIARAQNVQIFSLGISLGADQALLNNISSGSDGAVEFVEAASDMASAVRTMFTSRNAQLWNVNELFVEILPNGQSSISFDVPGGVDRFRISAVLDNYTAFRESDIEATLTGPSTGGQDDTHAVTGQSGSTVAVWSTVLTSPQAGTYELNFQAGSPPSGSHRGLSIFADSYSDITIEATLLPGEEGGYTIGQTVDVDVVVTDGSGNALSDVTITGSVNGVTGSGGAAVTFAPNSGRGSFVTPQQPGAYRLQLQAVLGSGLPYPLAVPKEFEVFGPEPVYLRSNEPKVEFENRLGPDEDSLSFAFLLEYTEEIRSAQTEARRSIPSTVQWVEPLVEPRGSSLQRWVRLETEDGRRVRLDGKTPFTIPNGGVNLRMVVEIPDPDDPDFGLLEDGRYIGTIKFRSAEAQSPLELQVIVVYVKPEINVTMRSGQVAFFWDPTTPRTVPLVRVSANYTKTSEFYLDVPATITVDGVHFADLSVESEGEQLEGDPREAVRRYGPFELSRTAREFDLTVTPVSPENGIFLPRTPDPIPVEIESPYSVDKRREEMAVVTLGSAPAELPIIGSQVDLPVIGPLSFYLSHLVAYAIFLTFLLFALRRFRDLFRYPAQLQWRRNRRVRARIPQTVSVMGAGKTGTLALPRRWTKVRGSGTAAKLSLDEDDRLIISNAKRNLLTIDDQLVSGGATLEEGDSFGVGPQRRNGTNSAWEVTYQGGDSETGDATFRITKSAYNPNFIRWFVRFIVLVLVFAGIVQLARSEFVARFVYSIEGDFLQGPLAWLLTFVTQ